MDSTNILDLANFGQAEKEDVVNALVQAASHALLFGKRDSTTTALTWGYYGGRQDGTSVANGTLALTDSTTNYVVANRTTLASSVSTSLTNWNDTVTYGRAYKITTSGGTAASWEDHRHGSGGILGGGEAGAALPQLTGDVTNYVGSPADANATLISNDAVTNAKLANMANATIKGRTTAGTGDPEDLTSTQVAAILATNVKSTESIILACSDETTALATGTAKITFRMPYAFTLTDVRAALSTAQSTGSVVTVNVKESGTTIFSTKPTFDNTEKTTTTAATPPVISDAALADDAEMTVDIDQIGDGTAKGLKVTLIGHRA